MRLAEREPTISGLVPPAELVPAWTQRAAIDVVLGAVGKRWRPFAAVVVPEYVNGATAVRRDRRVKLVRESERRRLKHWIVYLHRRENLQVCT